jgi:hypothetical protein
LYLNWPSKNVFLKLIFKKPLALKFAKPLLGLGFHSEAKNFICQAPIGAWLS